MIKQCLILFISNIKFWIQRIGARAYTNKWICNIAISRNLANLDISSLDDLANEMVPPSMCLDLWCDRGSLPCAMAPLLSQ